MQALYAFQLVLGISGYHKTERPVFAPEANIFVQDTLKKKNLTLMSTQSNLEQAANGLLMMSESDYPFEYFATDDTTINESLLLKLADKPQGTLIEKTTVEHLFRNMADPNSPSVKAETSARFREFIESLKNELTEIAVYRVGEIQIQVFIIGINIHGTVSGMRTLLIET
ncbi:nuclease A inhibitor family protein [Mucilaginibacter sp. CSA2-8R]|uniref:nuclease A inhibitor family protein n=1 Tax=Mucilaginibacter sp. CSA2-8R TaxID=3141542 RepID=UPI00315D6CD4